MCGSATMSPKGLQGIAKILQKNGSFLPLFKSQQDSRLAGNGKGGQAQASNRRRHDGGIITYVVCARIGRPVDAPKDSPLLRIFWKTSWGVSSLKGGTPVRNSNRHTPRAHQSTLKSTCKRRPGSHFS